MPIKAESILKSTKNIIKPSLEIKLSKENVEVINEVYGELSKQPGFPKGFCQIGTILGTKLGYDSIYGRFKEDNGHYDTHFWNKDKETQTIIDFAAKQYGEDKPYIIPTSSPHYERYHEYLNHGTKVSLNALGAIQFG